MIRLGLGVRSGRAPEQGACHGHWLTWLSAGQPVRVVPTFKGGMGTYARALPCAVIMLLSARHSDQGVASLPEHVPGPASRARRRPRARPACLAAASPRCSAPRPSGACMQVVAVSTSVLQLIGTSAAHHADASSARQSQSQRCRGSSCLGSRPGATAQRISVFWVRIDAWLCAPPSDLQLEANAGPRVMWATASMPVRHADVQPPAVPQEARLEVLRRAALGRPVQHRRGAHRLDSSPRWQPHACAMLTITHCV